MPSIAVRGGVNSGLNCGSAMPDVAGAVVAFFPAKFTHLSRAWRGASTSVLSAAESVLNALGPGQNRHITDEVETDRDRLGDAVAEIGVADRLQAFALVLRKDIDRGRGLRLRCRLVLAQGFELPLILGRHCLRRALCERRTCDTAQERCCKRCPFHQGGPIDDFI